MIGHRGEGGTQAAEHLNINLIR